MIVNIQRGKELYVFVVSKIESIKLFPNNLDSPMSNTSEIDIIEVVTAGKIHFIEYHKDDIDTGLCLKDFEKLLNAIITFK